MSSPTQRTLKHLRAALVHGWRKNAAKRWVLREVDLS
jgi:hypothetical protein